MFKKALIASAAIMSAGVASAEITGNFAITSDYLFRGVSSGQAVSGGLEASAGGAYAGVWLSNAALGTSESNDEVNYYVGYGFGLGESVSMDMGYIRYTSDSEADYPTADDLDEVYLGLNGENWGATLFYGDPDLTESGTDDTYFYLDLGYVIPTGEATSIALHAGYLSAEEDDADAMDASIGYNVGDFTMGLAYRDAEINAVESADEEVQMFVSWSKDFDVK